MTGKGHVVTLHPLTLAESFAKTDAADLQSDKHRQHDRRTWHQGFCFHSSSMILQTGSMP